MKQWSAEDKNKKCTTKQETSTMKDVYNISGRKNVKSYFHIYKQSNLIYSQYLRRIIHTHRFVEKIFQTNTHLK